MLQVDDLDVGRRYLPEMKDSVTATNPLAHIDATRAGGGIGLIATFVADRRDGLVRILPDRIAIAMEYWMVTRPDTLRRPAVAGVVRELQYSAAALPGLTPPGTDQA